MLSFREFSFKVCCLLLCVFLHQASFCRCAEASEDLQFSAMTIARQSHVLPGGTLLLLASVANEGDAPAEGSLVTTLQGQPLLQSARRIVMPPHSSEQIEVYVQLPKSIAETPSIEITMTLNVDYAGREVLLERDGLPVIHTLRLPVDKVRSFAAFAMDAAPALVPPWHWPQPGIHSSYELAVAARVDAGNSRRSASFDTQALPLNESDWNGLTLTVIADPAILDEASIEPLKKFVSRGNNIWIMLDKVPTEMIRSLLADGQTCETVGEVELNEFTIEMYEATGKYDVEDRTVVFADPIKMKRVIQTGGRVSHRVDGWPAAIWMQVGNGEVLLTTLDSLAWIEERTDATTDVQRQTPYTSRVWARELVVNANALPTSSEHSSALDYPLKHIGNPVVPRAWVAAALLGFCGLLVLLGAWRAAVGELSSVGVLAPMAAGLVSVALLIAASSVRRDISETVAKLQVIQVTDDGGASMVHEQAAVYVNREVEMSLQSEVDGRATAKDVASGILRFETTNFQQWNLTSKSWPTGIWRYDADFSLPVEDLIVEASLNERGVELVLPTLPSPLEDPVFAFAVGGPMLCSIDGTRIMSDGRLSAGGEQWIAGTLMTDEQQRRAMVYQDFFRSDREFPSIRKILLGWTTPWPGGPTWNREYAMRGAALVALPVRLMRPKVGAEIFVPHGMIELRHAPNQVGRSIAYDQSSGTWVDELTIGSKVQLSFHLPPQVVPITARRIEFDLDIKAPNRTVKIIGKDAQGNPIEIAELVSPSIPWKSSVSDPKILEGARAGTIDIVLDVSERTDAGSDAEFSSIIAWQVGHFRASVRGSVAKSSSLSNDE